MNFGPPYPKINTVFKRDDHGQLIDGQFSCPEFKLLNEVPWTWTEKIDGTNIRLFWDGEGITMGGRTDRANLPAPLVENLRPRLDAQLWTSVFPDSADVSVYGEGYGAGIQKGGIYRPEQDFIVFDVRIGRWWLQRDDVVGIAKQLGFDVVPQWNNMTLNAAINLVREGSPQSVQWDHEPEGLVGTPHTGLLDRSGKRIMTKIKGRDWNNGSRS